MNVISDFCVFQTPEDDRVMVEKCSGTYILYDNKIVLIVKYISEPVFTCLTPVIIIIIIIIIILFLRSGSLSPRHGASSGCGWRNGLQYGG
jgi:hypothetical protein